VSRRQINAYALTLNVKAKTGSIRLWLTEGSDNPTHPDHELPVDLPTFAAAAGLLQNDRDGKTYFDASSQEISSGGEG
jgi:hypothetical protein